jgi:hypothetical protein
MKRLAIITLLALSVNAFATPDYQRSITEIVLGRTNDGLIIYQQVRDTSMPGEDYILIKDIVDKQFVLKQKIAIKNMEDVQKIIQAKDFFLVIPDLLQEKYIQLYGGNDHIYYLGTNFYVYDLLPKELWSFRVDKIEGIFKYKGYEFVILLLVSENGFEQIRKVLPLKPPKED